MSEIKLLACPFCGHPAKIKPHDDKIIIECGNYECNIIPFTVANSKEEAAAKWNTRIKPIKRVKSHVSEKENRADN